MDSSVAFIPSEVESPWNVLSREWTLPALHFRRILLAALDHSKHPQTLNSEGDYDISRGMMVACARDGYMEKRSNSDYFEGGTC